MNALELDTARAGGGGPTAQATDGADADSVRRLLTSIADNIAEGIYRSDAAHRLTFVNRAYLRMFGYEELAELQAIRRERLYADPAVRSRLLALLQQHEGFQDEEVEYVRRDGTHFWGLASGRVVRDTATGRVAYHVGAITDITERRRAAEEIRRLNQTLERRVAERTAELSASEARLRTIVEHAPEAIVVYDGDTGRFVDCNANATRLYGLDREQLRQKTPADVSPPVQPDGRRSTEAALERVIQALAGGDCVFEWVHRHASGRLIPCEVRLVRLPGEGAALLRASIIDNTDRHRRELVQQATYAISEAVLRTDDLPSLYRQIHSIVRRLMPADNFYIALCDPAAEVFSFPYFVDERDQPPAPLKITTGLTGTVIRTGTPHLVTARMPERQQASGQAVLREPEGETVYTETGTPAAVWLGAPLKVGDTTFGVLAVQDYHNERAYGEEEMRILSFVAIQTALAIQRKRAEAELRRALERERELGALKSNFVSLVSHEFRTPLGIIMSSAEILRDYLTQLDPEERQHHLNSIQRNTRRMSDMMEDVLLLAGMEAGTFAFSAQPLDLEHFGRTVTQEVLSATDRRCPIQFQAASSMPTAQADERLLGHLFTNLLTNAVKYSDPGRSVVLTIDRDHEEAVCVVRDQGIGIAEADQAGLFQAFHRGTNVGQRPGTGLGLVVVKRCVERHGGSIHLASQPGIGTTVTVRLPVFGPRPNATPGGNPSRS